MCLNEGLNVTFPFHQAGYTPSQLVGSGAGFSLKDVRAAGFTDEELLAAGYRLKEINADDGTRVTLQRQSSKIVPVDGSERPHTTGFRPGPIKKLPSGLLSSPEASKPTTAGIMSRLGSVFSRK